MSLRKADTKRLKGPARVVLGNLGQKRRAAAGSSQPVLHGIEELGSQLTGG